MSGKGTDRGRNPAPRGVGENGSSGRSGTHESHIRQVLLAIRTINKLIVQEDDPRRLVERACEALTGTLGYYNAWIALFSGASDPRGADDGPFKVAWTASAGFDGGFEPMRERLVAGDFTGCMARALDHDGTVVVDDPPARCPDCPLSKDYSGRSGLIHRLVFEGTVHGMLAVSVPAEYAVNDEEQDVFDELAGDVAFALHRLKTEERLRESRRRYREIFERSRDGFVVVDGNGRIIDANPAFCSMLGYTLDELRAMPDFYSITPERWHEWERDEIWEKRLVARGYSGLYEKEYIRRDGTVFPVELRSYVVRRPDGSIDYLWGTTRDISRRRRDEEVLLDEHKRLEFVIDASRLGTWEWNVQTNETVFNETWAELLGYTLDELTPYDYDTWLRLVHPDDAGEAEERLAICVAGETPDYECEFRMRHKDGRWVWMLDRGRIMTRDGDGRPLSMFGTHADITDRRRKEERTRRDKRRLEAVTAILQHRADTVQEFLDHALDEALAMTGSAVGYIYFYDEDSRRFVLNTWSKGVMEQCAVADPATCYELDGTGIWGEAVRQRKPILINDFQAEHPLKKGYPEGHVRLKRFLSVPVLHNDRIVAVVGVGNKAADYDEPDILQLALLMEAAWKSVETMRGELALQERERYLSTIIGTTVDGFWVIDSEGRMVEVNDAYCGMTGYARDELIGMSIADLDADETPEVTAARMGRIIAGGSEIFETRHRRKDGSLFAVEVSVVYLRERGGQFVCFCRDLTERKKHEERIALLGRMLDDAPASITIHDTGGTFMYANSATLALHGYDDMDDFLAVNLHDLDVPESEALLAERVDRIERFGEDRFEVFHFRRDGSIFPLEVLAKTIEWEGRPAILSIATDITERKSLERQLNQAQKMEAVGRLAGGVAHDFNNMLNVILGHIELTLFDMPDGTPLKADIEEIQKAAFRSADLTRQLLAFARKQTITPRVLDVNATIEAMLKMLKRLIGEDVALRWEPAGDAGKVHMDPAQVDQILANLVVNARDAIGPDGGTIIIETGNAVIDEEYCSTHAGFVPGAYVMFSVSDDGCGMDEQTRGSIFEPFFTTKGVGEGTGLGLATVYGIVKQNRGFINVYSEPGRGTTFRIYLPVHKKRAAATAGEYPMTGTVTPGTETILLVEDETAILSIARKMLERLGYTVLPAATPGEALRIAREHGSEIHLLVSDVVMPEMNGRELARRMLSLYPDIRRLFMSGYTANVIAHQGVLDEGVHFIQKPFSMEELGRKTREALNDPV